MKQPWRAQLTGWSGTTAEKRPVYHVVAGTHVLAEFLNEEDALLMAAAPELAAKLRELVDCVKRNDGSYLPGCIAAAETVLARTTPAELDYAK